SSCPRPREWDQQRRTCRAVHASGFLCWMAVRDNGSQYSHGGLSRNGIGLSSVVHDVKSGAALKEKRMITTPSQQTRTQTTMPLLALCLGYFMTILDVTIVNVALVDIKEHLSANVTGL